MIRKIVFNAEPVEQVKLNLDLKNKTDFALPDDMVFKFNLSGECDKKTLSKLIRLVKFNAKTDEQISNKT